MVGFGAALGLISGLPRLAADVTALDVTCLDLAGIGFDFWLRPGMANIAKLEFLLHGENTLADHHAMSDKIRAKTALKLRHRNSRKAELRS